MENLVPNHTELISRSRAGDRDAVRQLYNLYKRAMYNVGYRIVNDADDAKDVLQESFISAFNNLENYRGDAAFGSWLKRIVVNKAINMIRKRRFERLPELGEVEVAEQEPVDSMAGFAFSVEKVRKAIEQLPDGYRVVLSLYLLEGYDHAEIAGILGITESTSKSQYNRSKKKLKQILESYEK
ncbi:MAG: RNA polymerase sigma factor [Bacteroidetes bacterium]|nr:RNA polymerase sigma factor [Bacteroidota bacterium]